jgi:hypothetical protein
MGKMPLRQRLSDLGHKQFSDEYLKAILAFELISSGTLLFLAFQVLEYQRYYLSIVLFGLGWASAASALLFSIFPVGKQTHERNDCPGSPPRRGSAPLSFRIVHETDLIASKRTGCLQSQRSTPSSSPRLRRGTGMNKRLGMRRWNK